MSWLLYALGLPPALAFLLFAMSKMLPQKFAQLAQFAAFCIASVFFMCVSALYGVFVAIPLRTLGYGGCIQWTVGRVFKWCMWWSTGVIFEIIDSGRVEGGRRGGEEALQTRPAVFMGNHQTELDVLMLGTVFPKYCSVTAKKSLKWMPFLGWFMTLSKSVFIDRANRATARAAFDGAAKVMQTERQSVFIFPEGTRSYATSPELLPFKKGGFHLAIQAQVPIVPVVVANYSHVLNLKEKKYTPGVISVSVLPAISTKGMTGADADALTTKTRDAMMDELIRLSHLNNQGNGMPLPRADAVEKMPAELRKRTVGGGGVRLDGTMTS